MLVTFPLHSTHTAKISTIFCCHCTFVESHNPSRDSSFQWVPPLSSLISSYHWKCIIQQTILLAWEFYYLFIISMGPTTFITYKFLSLKIYHSTDHTSCMRILLFVIKNKSVLYFITFLHCCLLFLIF